MRLLGPAMPGVFTTLTHTTPAFGDSSTLSATTAFVANATTGVVTVSTIGGTTTLTAAQASVPLILIAGALTSNATIVVPPTGIYTVSNRTSGAFSVTVKTAAGTGVAVTQGVNSYLAADGTNVISGRTDFNAISVTNSTITSSTLGISTVQPATGTGVVAVPLVNILTATFHPYAYGIKADGTTNDTAGWINLFADIAAKTYGDIVLPNGYSVITPGSLNIPSNTTIRGRGQTASGFVRPPATSGTLLRLNGTATGNATHCVNCTFADFGIKGGDQAGILMQAIYSSHHSFDNVRFGNSLDAGFQCVELWDSSFANCLWENCGMASSATAYTTTPTPRLGSEALQILGGIAASGFGSSADSNNQLSFSRCRVESFGAGGITIQKLYGTNAGAANYGIRFSDMKIESLYFSGINMIAMSDDAQAVFFERSYIAVDGASGTNLGSMDLFWLGAGFGNQIRAITFNIGLANAVRSCIYHWGNPLAKVEDIFVNGAVCTTAILYIAGGSPVDWRNINYVNNQAGAIVGPTYYAPYGLTPTLSTALTASGTTQATALLLTSLDNVVTTAAASTGVRLQAAAIGIEIKVRNRGANALLVYPPVNGTIESLAVNAGFSLAVGATGRFTPNTATHWYQG